MSLRCDVSCCCIRSVLMSVINYCYISKYLFVSITSLQLLPRKCLFNAIQRKINIFLMKNFVDVTLSSLYDIKFVAKKRTELG